MKAFITFLRTTLIGGVLFLLPLVVLALVIGKAQRLSRGIVAPLASRIPVKTVVGIPTAKLLAIGVIVLFCFLAGLFARTVLARKTVAWLEEVLLCNIPGYDFVKGISESLVGFETVRPYQVVLARIEEAWQIGFLMERLGDDHYAVFVPNAPRPWSGSVYFMREERFKRIDISRTEALKCLRRMGVGAGQVLHTGISE